MFPLVGIGLLGLTRSTAVARDRAGLLDFLILTTAAAFLLWAFAVGPFLSDSGLTAAERSTLAAYALADVVLLATTVRLLAAIRGRPAGLLLVAGAAGLLVADLFHAVGTFDGTWRAGGPVELGWLSLYATWGAAALHPSMVRLTEPSEPPPVEVSRLRLVLLGLAALLAPAVLLLQLLTGEVRDGVVIAVVSGLTFVLVLSRLADAVDAHRLVLARERTLRESGAALVSAADVDEVGRAVRAAVSRLMPPGAAHETVFAVNRADGMPAATSSIWGPTVPVGPELGVPGAAARRTRVLRVATLRPALAGQLADFGSAVLCPLVLDEPVAGPPRVGALLVGADDAVLPLLRDSLEVLAAQAALALARISLNQEISRRDSEEYFRSLVQNASDVFMIVEGDQRVRYVSPSVSRVLGVEPAEGVELAAMVHPDDRPTVATLLVPTGEQWLARSLRRLDGERVHLEVSCRDLRRDRTVRGLVLTIRDVTERRRLEQELTHRADHDALTGLANRAHFTEQAHSAVERANQEGRTVGVLCVDLDEFSRVNESHGHAVGDSLLVAVGRRIDATVARQGTVARLGGDEFAVLVPGAESPEEVERLAERLIAALGEPLGAGDVTVTGSASIGVATTVDATDAEELIRHASLALYVSKGAGKGRWCRYRPVLHTAIVQRLELRAALAAAVDRLHRRGGEPERRAADQVDDRGRSAA
ncbi:MAG TPA: sensor domain-containing diguanylate cyclase, partial [Micromonospora sp.]